MAACNGNDYAKGNPGGGRPTKYTTEALNIAKAMSKLGAIDQEIADELGVAVSTITNWKLKHEEFFSALKEGKEKADDRVEASLYKKALGYYIDSVKIFQFQGQELIVPYQEYIHPDTTAAIFWLKNRKPEQYRANPESTGGTDDLPSAINKLIDKLPN